MNHCKSCGSRTPWEKDFCGSYCRSKLPYGNEKGETVRTADDVAQALCAKYPHAKAEDFKFIVGSDPPDWIAQAVAKLKAGCPHEIPHALESCASCAMAEAVAGMERRIALLETKLRWAETDKTVWVGRCRELVEGQGA